MSYIKEVGLKFTADGSVDFQKTIKAIKSEMGWPPVPCGEKRVPRHAYDL